MLAYSSAEHDSNYSRIILQKEAAEHSLRTMTTVMWGFLAITVWSLWIVVFALRIWFGARRPTLLFFFLEWSPPLDRSTILALLISLLCSIWWTSPTDHSCLDAICCWYISVDFFDD